VHVCVEREKEYLRYKIIKWIYSHVFQNLMCKRIAWESCFHAESNSVGLSRAPDDVDDVGLRTIY